MNGVSKKLCISVMGIQAIVHLAEGHDPIYYACMITGIVIAYKLVQCRIDVIRSKYGVTETNKEDKE